jgi:acyl dehydratase
VPPSDSTGLRFEDVRPGHALTVSETYGGAELDAFATLSGDHSSIHTESQTARQYGYPDRMTYGFLTLTLISRMVGSKLHHALCASVSVDFVSPAFPGERIDLIATVDRVQAAMRSVLFKLRFERGGELLARGRLTTKFL